MSGTTRAPQHGRRSARLVLLVGLIAGSHPSGARSDDPPPGQGRYVRLIQRAPEARLGAIIEVAGRRGDAGDLAYLLDRAAAAAAEGGFAPVARRAALEALVEAATTRDLRPAADLGKLAVLLAADHTLDEPTRTAATRLAGLWRLAATVPILVALAEGPATPAPVRLAACDALARINNDDARAALGRLAGPAAPPEVKTLAGATLARVDPLGAAERAARALAASQPGTDLASLLGPTLDQQGGADRLAAALERQELTTETARRVLGAIQALGRSDEILVASLTRRAGIATNRAEWSPAEQATFGADVAAHGDPARGEAVFRRAEINCLKCHAVAGAAGGVGPDLSSLGLSSPVDYIVRSILEPDQSIKEEYQTRIISTDDGRVVQGIVVLEDDRRIVLKDATGERREVAVGAIEESKRGGSLMPSGLINTLSRADFVDLVRFLSELGRPGPYAIRSTPTIRRWRTVGPLATVPGGSLSAQALYAWTSGDLPVGEILAATGGPIGQVEGEVDVTVAGPLRLRFGPGPHPGIAAALDDRSLAIGPDGDAPASLDIGLHRVTVRVDARSEPRLTGSIRVEVVREAGSPAEFVVVGGR